MSITLLTLICLNGNGTHTPTSRHTGKNTLHDTVGICYQNKPAETVMEQTTSEPAVPTESSLKRRRQFEAPDFNKAMHSSDIAPCPCISMKCLKCRICNASAKSGSMDSFATAKTSAEERISGPPDDSMIWPSAL